jgi:hypothetical protein
MSNKLPNTIFFFMLISLSAILNAQPNVKPDNKIGKKEFEVAFIAGASDRGALAGTQLTYRFPIGCKFKLGGGFHYSIDETGDGSHPGIFLELSKYVGNKQKWKFSGQVGKAFYETSGRTSGINGSTYYTKISDEVFYHLNTVYRMNIGKKLVFFAGPYYLLQTFEQYTEVKDGLGQNLNPYKSRAKQGGGGIRFGFVF